MLTGPRAVLISHHQLQLQLQITYLQYNNEVPVYTPKRFVHDEGTGIPCRVLPRQSAAAAARKE